ncbi:MAG: protein-disulfide reductase DsbD [Gammaproteobacteria bacterium]|nr:protein-disulfide reductase DsbD [Gammaproteobacteria bacterium]
MKYFWAIILFCLALLSFASSSYAHVEPLTADQAFQVTGTARDNQTILISWKIAPGYYLYRDKFHFKTMRTHQAVLSQPIMPPESFTKSIPGLGSFKAYKNNVTIIIPVLRSKQATLPIQVSYQGCSDDGFCYPPTTKVIPIDLEGDYMIPVNSVDVDIAPTQHTNNTRPKQENKMFGILDSHSLTALIFGFLIFGILISLTPCVLPMIPILSGIIVGRGKISHLHSFLLSLAYVMGMAVTYAVAGLIFGIIGASIQAIFQQTWIIILFSLIFVAMALSLFGFYNIQLPSTLRSKMAHLSEHQKRGSFIGVILMGIFSTLILSPCVTPPLVAVLSYISQSGNAWTGFIALFCMGIGMGAPLLLIGAFGPKFLPHSGRWMNATKSILGVLMLGVAIWMLQRVLPDRITMLLWAGLVVGSAAAMGAFASAKTNWQRIKKAISIVLFVYGLLLVVGAFLGNTNPLQPLNIFEQRAQLNHIKFISVKAVEDVNHQLKLGKHQNKPALLDFYADWCISCKEMDDTTFSNPAVKKYLSQYVLMRANVTKNDMQDKILERHFRVVAPPTIIVFDRNHKEIKSARIVGMLSPEKFLQQLKQAIQP